LTRDLFTTAKFLVQFSDMIEYISYNAPVCDFTSIHGNVPICGPEDVYFNVCQERYCSVHGQGIKRFLSCVYGQRRIVFEQIDWSVTPST